MRTTLMCLVGGIERSMWTLISPVFNWTVYSQPGWNHNTRRNKILLKQATMAICITSQNFASI